MTSLVTADGRLLKRTAPSGMVGQGLSGGVWTAATDANAASDTRLVSYESIYETQPIVAAAVNKLCRQAATLPLKVYRRDTENDHVRVIDHPLEMLLRRPVPRFGATALKQWALMPTLIHGNGLIAKWREDPDGPPTALLPVDWRYAEAYAAQGGPVEWWATTQTGERRWIEVGETLHFAWEAPSGPLGVSPLKQLGVMIRIEEAAQRYQTATMNNGVRPSLAVIPPSDANMNNKDVRDFYRNQVESLHKGVDRAGKMALFPPGADAKVLSFSAADARLIEQRYVGFEEVQMVFDLPGPLLGDLRHGTYSNVTELNKQLYKSVLRPWLTLIEETIQAQLIDPEPEWDGLFVEFDTGAQIKGDPLVEAQAIKTEIESGTMTPNEGRKLQNRPRDSDPAADQLYLPTNNLSPVGEPPPEGGETDVSPPMLP